MQDVADIQEMRLCQVENVLSALFDGQTNLASVMQEHTKGLGAIRVRMDGLEQRMDRVELRLESVESRLESLETRSAKTLELLTLALDDLAFIKNSMKPET